jgi:hypothetical protein
MVMYKYLHRASLHAESLMRKFKTFVRNPMTNYAQRIFMLLILTFTTLVTSIIYSQHKKICG